MNAFPKVLWILSQLTAFVLKIQQKNFPWTKICCKTDLVPQYLLTRKLSVIFSCECMRYLLQVCWWFPLKWVINICVFTNIMNKSAQLRNRELRLLALFLLTILEMRSSATLEYAACFCFFRKL